MKRHRKKIIAIVAGCMFLVMMMLNLKTTINGFNLSVDEYSAFVKGNIDPVEDSGGDIYKGGYETCWNDGFPIYICRSGIGNCCVICQDPC